MFNDEEGNKLINFNKSKEKIIADDSRMIAYF